MFLARCTVTLVCALLAESGVAQTETTEDADAPKLPPAEVLEAEGAIIGNIVFDRQNVFDLSNPAENNALYRLANRWHIVTREKSETAKLSACETPPQR